MSALHIFLYIPYASCTDPNNKTYIWSKPSDVATNYATYVRTLNTSRDALKLARYFFDDYRKPLLLVTYYTVVVGVN